MHRVLGAVGLSAAIVAFSASSTQAQLIDRSGSVERRARADGERDARVLRPQGLAGPAATKADTVVRLIPSFKSGDTSASFGATGQFVYDTTESADGLGYFTIRPSYATVRKTEDHTHQRGIGLGADVQLNRNSSVLGTFSAGVDYLDVKDGFAFTSAGVEWDYAFGGSGATAIATLAGARFSPHGTSASVSDVVPGLALDYKTKTTTPVRLGAEYTFKNDVDEEDDYAFSMRVAIHPTASVRVGTGKHGKVFASFTQVLDWP